MQNAPSREIFSFKNRIDTIATKNTSVSTSTVLEAIDVYAID